MVYFSTIDISRFLSALVFFTNTYLRICTQQTSYLRRNIIFFRFLPKNDSQVSFSILFFLLHTHTNTLSFAVCLPVSLSLYLTHTHSRGRTLSENHLKLKSKSAAFKFLYVLTTWGQVTTYIWAGSCWTCHWKYWLNICIWTTLTRYKDLVLLKSVFAQETVITVLK